MLMSLAELGDPDAIDTIAQRRVTVCLREVDKIDKKVEEKLVNMAAFAYLCTAQLNTSAI